MRHIKKVTMFKAQEIDGDTLSTILDQVFGFVLELVDQKGKATE